MTTAAIPGKPSPKLVRKAQVAHMRVFDAAVGQRIAQMTARNLLATIADSIEADFIAVEKTKTIPPAIVPSP